MKKKRTGIERSITVSCENVDCVKPQDNSFTPSEFQDWIQEGEFDCKSCGAELSVSGLRLECYICDAQIEFSNLAEAQFWIGDKCPECAGRDLWEADFYSVVIAGSWAAEYGIYDWTANGKRFDVLERPGRSDYWEGLAHFCKAEEFIAIYNDRCIRAAPTGLYAKKHPLLSRAVCLTETTFPNWAELQARHGDYGFIFRKRDIIRLSGGPAIYLPQPLLDAMTQRKEAIPPSLWPFLNKLTIPSITPGQRHDFLHEREWRVPQDISFDVVQPYAVTFPKRRPGIEGEELILQAAREFQELSTFGTLK